MNFISKKVNPFFTISCFLLLFASTLMAQKGELSFFPNGTYLKEIPSPAEALGFPLGERPVRYWEVVQYFKLLAEKSPKVRLVESGQSHEKRKLYYLLVTSEKNFAQLTQIKKNISKLADPRLIGSEQEAKNIIATTPAIAWMMYCIHGNELSGTDASLQLAYQLAAGTDSLTNGILEEVVVSIDPMENPDGRERFLAQVQQWTGKVPNSDTQSIQHTTLWPWGRTNHYLFDLNRDWFILAHPETKARVKAIAEWCPQLVVDGHEMGSADTFLFNPPREPINPNLSPLVQKWWPAFSSDQAKAFDQYGWSYYTREWLEEWYPGYGSSWPSYRGAVSILYEQARTEGSFVKREDGTYLTFREAIHHQFTSSIANLDTVVQNREALLKDFYTQKKEAIFSHTKEMDQICYILPGTNVSRANQLVERLAFQGIEIQVAKEKFVGKDLKGYGGAKISEKELPAGTYIIRLAQPLRPLIQSILEFDPRLSISFLNQERVSLEKGEGTLLYEVSSWSLLLAYGVEAYYSVEMPKVKSRSVDSIIAEPGKVLTKTPKYGFLIEYEDDKAVYALLRLLEQGYQVRVARKKFQIENKSYRSGTLLLRLHENKESLLPAIQKIAKKAEIKIQGVNTALSQKGPDLGGGEFQLLRLPKIAVVTGPDINMYHFGTLWYQLDYELEYRFTILNYNDFNGVDLRKYNVLVLPSPWSGASAYRKIFGESGLKKLKNWVANGGTLIGIGGGAAYLAEDESDFSGVRLRREALKDLSSYNEAFQEEYSIGKTQIDPAVIWDGKEEEKIKIIKPELAEEEELKKEDKRQQTYMPRGAILRVHLNPSHWLNFGVGKEVSAITYTSYAFLSKTPVETAGRYGNNSKIRIAGLLWPEARKRWALSAYLTRESYEKGQIILFAGEPNFRAYFYGTSRLLLNSLFFGPGFGTQRVAGW